MPQPFGSYSLHISQCVCILGGKSNLEEGKFLVHLNCSMFMNYVYLQTVCVSSDDKARHSEVGGAGCAARTRPRLQLHPALLPRPPHEHQPQGSRYVGQPQDSVVISLTALGRYQPFG